MPTSGTRRVVHIFTGTIAWTQTFSAAANAAASAAIEIKTLASGANTITVPTSGTVPTSVTIIPPSGNTQLITLKGVSGDTGVGLHLTDPTSIGLGTAVTTFVLNAAGTVTGLRLVWN
jgi:hypothetical protein